MWIEIFRTGKHTDSSGRSEDFPPHRLDKIASIYNSRILEEPTMSAPVVKGHPQNDAPAYGWVRQLARRGSRLVAFVEDIAEDFAEEVRQGKFKKVSISLYPDLMLKHIGFLGAASPAVKGLEAAKFTEVDGLKVYEYADFIMSENDFQSTQKENEKLKREIELIRKESRLRQFREYANGLISGETGAKILPSQAAGLVDILEMAYKYDENSQGDKSSSAVDKVKEFFSSIRPVLSTKEFATKHFSEYKQECDFDKSNIDSRKLELHKKAIEFQESVPGISYEEAVLEVSKNLI